MIRVIQLVEDLKVGGLERVIAAIALNLDKNNFALSVWCVARGGTIADELIQKGISVEVLGITSYFNPINILKLAGRLRKAQPTIIHTHGYFAGTIGRLAGLLAGTPVFIHHMHSTCSAYTKRNLLVERILGLFTHTILCCSQFTAVDLHKASRIPAAKMVVVYNGRPVHKKSSSDPNALRTGLGIKPHDRVIVTVASLTDNKGHKFLIEAVGMIAAEIPAAKLLIVGDGIVRTQLEQQAADLGITNRVVFAGIRTDIPDLLAIAELFVLASWYREGLPLSIVEAMAAGLPVIGTGLGGIPEVIVPHKTGLLVPPRNSTALAAAIRELLANPGKAREIGQNGLRRFREVFTEEKMIRHLEQIYNGAVHQ